jgi:cytosine/adenosine deaminase-related metal-dependent hydrolase
MTKQEEIREWIRDYLAEAMLGNYDEDDLDALATQACLKLHSQGVVIKTGEIKYVWVNGKIEKVVGDIAAVEPLIEEGE